ncbi:uncharacterized protein WM294_008094 [Sarcoramphus papa]
MSEHASRNERLCRRRRFRKQAVARCQLFPWCPLLHLSSAAKAESVLGSRHLQHVPQMMETGLLIEYAVGERTTGVYSPQSNAQNTASVFCPQDVRRNCMIGTAALLISLPLAILLCCVVIRRRRKRKQRLSAASGAQRESGGCPSRPDSRTSHTSRPGTPESWTQRQQPPLRPAKPARPPSPRPPRPPSPAPAPQLLRNQPSAFQPQPQPKRPYRPPSPVVGPYGKG